MPEVVLNRDKRNRIGFIGDIVVYTAITQQKPCLPIEITLYKVNRHYSNNCELLHFSCGNTSVVVEDSSSCTAIIRTLLEKMEIYRIAYSDIAPIFNALPIQWLD